MEIPVGDLYEDQKDQLENYSYQIETLDITACKLLVLQEAIIFFIDDYDH